MSHKRFVVEDSESRLIEVDAADWMMAMVRGTKALGASPTGLDCEPRPGGVVFVTDPKTGAWWRVAPKDAATPTTRRAMWTPDGSGPREGISTAVASSAPPPNLRERLFEAATDLAAHSSEASAAGHVLSLAMALVPSEAGSVFRVTEDGAAFQFLVVEGGAKEALVGRRLPLDQGIVGAAFHAGVTIRVEDAQADPRHLAEIDQQTGFRTRSLLCVPIRPSAGFRGAIELLNPSDGFAPWQIEAVTELARSLAEFVVDPSE